MGEEVDNYNYDDDGELLDITHEGAWEAGVDGALPGILVHKAPLLGQSFRQEYYEDEAEDMALAVNLDATVVLPDGSTYDHCLQTLEWSPLDPAALEYKF